LALDEPTVGVDADARESFFALLDRLNSQGLTTILIDHNLQTVVDHADRIACLNRSLSYLGAADEFDGAAFAPRGGVSTAQRVDRSPSSANPSQ